MSYRFCVRYRIVTALDMLSNVYISRPWGKIPAPPICPVIRRHTLDPPCLVAIIVGNHVLFNLSSNTQPLGMDLRYGRRAQ